MTIVTCPRCGLLPSNAETHRRWHEELDTAFGTLTARDRLIEAHTDDVIERVRERVIVIEQAIDGGPEDADYDEALGAALRQSHGA